MTSSTAAPSSAAAGGEKSPADGPGDKPKVISHIRNVYKIGVVYWRHGLPENGKMKISEEKLSFKGILGKNLSLDLTEIRVEEASSMGGLVHDSFIISIAKPKEPGSGAEEGKEYRFSTGMKDTNKVVDKIKSAISNAKLTKEEEEFDAKSRTWGEDDFKKKKKAFKAPTPDPVLQKMEIIAERKLKGVSVKNYSEVAWSDKKPMYGPFLEQQGKNNVTISPWEVGKFEGDWCGETYTEKRIVTFNFMKQTIGQTLVEVKHTQQQRKEDEQCIVQIKMEMKGFPYADCFVVQVRHVASCDGKNVLKIQIGMHVEFLKSCIFEKKIRNNTGAETTKAQLALLEMILKGCAPYAKADVKKEKFRMPPDATLQKMGIITERKLRGVSVKEYHDVAWSDKKPMYGPFLEQQGKNNVTVFPWETGKFEGDWCGEMYTEKRLVTFSFMKKTIGQTLVEVKHTQQLRRKGNDQCIVHIEMEMKGFPYADCFLVEVRHVASRNGENDLNIQIGMHVEFLKSCMFEKKIRTNTGAETTKAQLALLEMILKGCAPFAKEVRGSSEDSENEGEGEELGLTAVTQAVVAPYPIKLPDPVCKALRFIAAIFISIFRMFIKPYTPLELFDPFPPTSIEEALRRMRASSKILEEISLKSISESRRKVIYREIALITKSIDKIEKTANKSNS